MPGLQDSQARSSILLELELNSWNRQGSGDSEGGLAPFTFDVLSFFDHSRMLWP